VLRPLGGQILTTGGKNNLYFNVTHFLTTGWQETGNYDRTIDVDVHRWRCLEWFMDLTGSKARSWLDGVETRANWPGSNPQASNPVYTFAPIKDIAVGWAQYQTADVPFDVYIDEVVIHDQRVGCD
jgi:hypothetical protein